MADGTDLPRDAAAVLELLKATDASPDSTARPLNYTQLQLFVQAAAEADRHPDDPLFYARILTAIRMHMESRFKIQSIEAQLASAKKQ